MHTPSTARLRITRDQLIPVAILAALALLAAPALILALIALVDLRRDNPHTTAVNHIRQNLPAITAMVSQVRPSPAPLTTDPEITC